MWTRNRTSIHRTTFSHTPRPACKTKPAEKEQDSSDKKSRYRTHSYKRYDGIKNSYVAEKTVWHIGLGLRLRYVARWSGYSTTDDTIKLPHDIRQRFLRVSDSAKSSCSCTIPHPLILTALRSSNTVKMGTNKECYGTSFFRLYESIL